jgi:hypothetical protein
MSEFGMFFMTLFGPIALALLGLRLWIETPRGKRWFDSIGGN